MLRNTMGGICDPNTAWMLLRSLETLELRMTRAGENAAKVCDFLRDHPKVEELGYLGMLEPAARQQDIYDRHCTGAGSTFSLFLKGGEARPSASSMRCKIAKLAVSLGGTETLASAPAAMTHLSVPDERKAALGHHRQSGAHLDRDRGCRRSDRRFRARAERGLAPAGVCRPILDRQPRSAREALQPVVRVHRDRLVGPFEHRRVAGMVGIEADVAARSRPAALDPGRIIRSLAGP